MTIRTQYLCLFVVFTGLFQAPADAFARQQISWPEEEWSVSTPEAEGIDPAVVDELVADFEARYQK